MTTQITRQQAIDDIESEGFAPKSFKSTKSTRLEDIPMPSLDLKPINLASLKNEVLCHPNVSASSFKYFYNNRRMSLCDISLIYSPAMNLLFVVFLANN